MVDRRCRPVGPAVVAAIEQAILDGSLQPGQVLPSQRLTADLMGLRVNTVNHAMREAARRGLVRASGRQGTVVVGVPHVHGARHVADVWASERRRECHDAFVEEPVGVDARVRVAAQRARRGSVLL